MCLWIIWNNSLVGGRAWGWSLNLGHWACQALLHSAHDVQLLRPMGHMGRSPSWIFKVLNFNCQYVSDGSCASPCQISRWSVKTFPIYGRFSICFSRWQPSAILFFLKFDNLTTHTLRRTNVCHHAKFHADRSSCSRDNYDRFSIFQNGERPPSWIFNTPIRTILEEYLVVIVTV